MKNLFATALFRKKTTRPAQSGSSYVGEYRLLHKYLLDRFADCVVLTFKEIEDLLGCALPESAWIQSQWWDDQGAAPRSVQAQSWLRAGRTATVNLSARHVTFDREPA